MAPSHVSFLAPLPIVSVVVSFLGLPFRIHYIEFVKPTKGTTMETIVTIGTSDLPPPPIPSETGPVLRRSSNFSADGCLGWNELKRMKRRQ